MDSQLIQGKVTFLAGRPSSGKTKTAVDTCRCLLSEGWNVIYYHAEGSIDSQPTSYGVETPDQLLQFQLVLDLNFDLKGLTDRIHRPSENSPQAGMLVVIDTVDLFDCDREELLLLIDSLSSKPDIHFLLLTYIPRSFEKRHKDHAEQFARETYSLNIDYEVIVLGNFTDGFYY